MLNNWIDVEVDKEGFPALIEVEPEDINLANAKFNKSQSTVVGTKRIAQNGNPWFDPASGRFAHSPPGVSIRAGEEFLSKLTNGGRVFITHKAQSLGANAIVATAGADNKVNITLFKDLVKVASFILPSESTPRGKVLAGTPDLEVPEQHVEGKNMFQGDGTTPPGVDVEEWARRMDAVRSLARGMEDISHGDAAELLASKLNRPLSDGELNQMVHDIRLERLNIVVDWLDHSLRNTGLVKSRKLVKVTPPKNWVRSTVAGLSNDEVKSVVNRLEALGHNRDDVTTNIIGRFSKPRQDQLRSELGTPE